MFNTQIQVNVDGQYKNAQLAIHKQTKRFIITREEQHLLNIKPHDDHYVAELSNLKIGYIACRYDTKCQKLFCAYIHSNEMVTDIADYVNMFDKYNKKIHIKSVPKYNMSRDIYNVEKNKKRKRDDVMEDRSRRFETIDNWKSSGLKHITTQFQLIIASFDKHYLDGDRDKYLDAAIYAVKITIRNYNGTTHHNKLKKQLYVFQCMTDLKKNKSMSFAEIKEKLTDIIS